MAKSSQLEDLKIKHREVARLSFDGFKPADIAAKTNVGLQTVYKILRDPICRGYIQGLADKVDKTSLSVRERLMKLNDSVLDRFEDIIEADSKAPYSVIAAVGKDILDRTGHKAPDKIDINHTLQGKSDAEIDAQIASLESQINSNYHADLSTNTNSEEDLELDSEEAAIAAEEAKINPKTDYKESI